MKLFCFLLMMTVSVSASALTTFTYLAPKNDKDPRARYGAALFTLALEKTLVSHGSYQVNLSPEMNQKRALETNRMENFFFRHSISKGASDKMGYVNFPVDLGIVGYRVFFVSPKAASAFSQVTNLEQLKKFSMVQGVGWLDTEILRHNGFKVIEGTNYEGLFKMIARNRADLFPRGANELLEEYRIRSNQLPLITETSIVLYYPLPRFFFTSKKNVAAIERIKIGLDIAFKDGSLQKLWKKYYSESVSYINFKTAKVFKIDNPFLKGLDESYKQYIITPELLINR